VSLGTIESKDLTLGELFNDFYVVPSYQREYIWQEKKQVKQLLQDVYNEFLSDDRASTVEYFIGSIVVCSRPDGVYELIDGQQRMTTAYIFVCALKNYLKELNPTKSTQALENLIATTDVDDEGMDIFRYRVVLQYEDSGDALKTIAQEKPDLDNINLKPRSVENIIKAYREIQEFLQNEFGQDDSAVRRFYAYFTKNIKLIRVKTISVSQALKVFETLNDRGVGLDSMDLLKNLLFRQTQPEDFSYLKDKWKQLVDNLQNCGEKPLRFLRYFILARYKVEGDQLREDRIYTWLVEHEAECGYKKDPFTFVDDLLQAASAYTQFLRGKDATGKNNRYLDNIRHLSETTRQHLILLLAAQHLRTDCFTELCRQLENLLFAYTITRTVTRDLERPFIQWASKLRQVKDRVALDEFIAQHVQPAKVSLATRYKLAFCELNEQSLKPKHRIRYVLGKLTQYVNEQAWGSNGSDVNLENFMSKQVEVEHILPQNPDHATRRSFDKLEEIEQYIYRLGNLTLLEKPINASIGNQLFSKKREAYRQSKFLLTKSLAEKIVVGTNTAVDRAVKGLETFETWTSQSIERRQTILTRLAQQVWEMPEVASEGDVSSTSHSLL
jgi:hypothetical protein